MRFVSSLALIAGMVLVIGCPTTSKDNGGDDTGSSNTGDDSGGGGGGGSVYEVACDRFDECNLLSGMSASECVQYFESCADDLLASEASDLEAALQECLDESNDTCSDFDTCYTYDVPYC